MQLTNIPFFVFAENKSLTLQPEDDSPKSQKSYKSVSWSATESTSRVEINDKSINSTGKFLCANSQEDKCNHLATTITLVT